MSSDYQDQTEKEYKAVMQTIEALLEKVTKIGGFHKLDRHEATMLSNSSKVAEFYEDTVVRLMAVAKPKTLQEAVEFKRMERKLTQAKLAKTLGIGAPKLSQILSGKREPDVVFCRQFIKN